MGQPGERIDFFMSHSWHDNADLKWAVLEDFVNKYYSKRNRYPTFWLDKVCIDHTNIVDSLTVLPVYVMACKRMLVLCGDTYLRRLWCAWELCTLFSFSSDDRVIERIEFVPLDTSDDKSDVEQQLKRFDHRCAHCYDPNEEFRLRQIIEAVGGKEFNARLRGLALAHSNYAPRL